MRAFLFCILALLRVARASLSLAVVVTRHGDRAPIYGWPSDRVALWEWPSGGGGLTPRGVRAMYDLGQRLRQRYVEEERLISGTYNRSEVYVRSSAVDRTLQSAYSLMYGLFPVGTGDLADVNALPPDFAGLPGRAQPIAIRSAPYDEDWLLIPGGDCPRARRLHATRRGSSEWTSKESEQAAVLSELTNATQNASPVRLREVGRVADTWKCQREHNVPLPAGASLERAMRLADWVRHFTDSGLEVHRLHAGLLMHDISKRLQNAADGVAAPRFVYYSAHDSTIAALLGAMGAYNGTNPPYNSTLIWELRGSSVSVQFNGVPVDVGCGEACALPEYLKYTRRVTVRGRAQRKRECLTGAARLSANMWALFLGDSLDADDPATAPSPRLGHTVPVLLAALFALLVGGSLVYAVRRRSGYELAAVEESANERVLRTYVNAGPERMLD